jgi:hypothetical protein
MSNSDDCSSNIHEFCGPCDCPCHGFNLSVEEAKYLVKNIQNEYLNKETYYFARDLFNRMEKFLAEADELVRRIGEHS